MRLALLLVLFAPKQDLNDKSYEKLRDQIAPSKEEVAWLAIPWHVSLWDAVIEAQKQEKPVLLYAMNGHPLACT